MSRRNQERVARKLMELEKGLSGLARARQVAHSDVTVTETDSFGIPVERDVAIPELMGEVTINQEQFNQDLAEARDRIVQAREDLDELADVTLPGIALAQDTADAAAAEATQAKQDALDAANRIDTISGELDETAQTAQDAWNLALEATANATQRVNLVTNPSFEVDTAGWNPVRSTLSRVTTYPLMWDGARSGDAIAELVANVGSGAAYIWSGDYALDGLSWVGVSALAATEAGVNVRLQVIWRNSGGQISTTSSPYVPAQFYPGARLVHAFEAPATATHFRVVVAMNASGVGDRLWVDSVISATAANEGSALSAVEPYFDGDSGERTDSAGVLYQSAWTGTPHASTSIETAYTSAMLEVIAEAHAATEAALLAGAKAEDAESEAATARAEAATAAGIAEGKGDVLIQPTTPTADMRKSTTLWIDTTNGNNTPKRWDGSDWVAVTDKAVVDAANAAAQAEQKATEALNAAGGKNKVFRSVSTPGTTEGTAVGDVWWRFAESTMQGPIIGQWTWDGSQWRAATIDSQIIANLTVDKLVVTGGAKFPLAVIDTLVGDDAFFRRAMAEQVIVTPENIIPGVSTILKNENAGWSNFTVNRGDPSRWLQGRQEVTTDVPFMVTAGVEYSFEMEVRSSVSGTSFYLQAVARSGQALTGTYIFSDERVTGTSSTWNRFETTWTPNVSGEIVLRFYSNHQNGADNPTGYQWFRNPTMRPRVGAIQLKNGVVTAPKIASDAIDTTHLSAGAVTSAKITADELTGLDIVGSKFRLLGDDGSEAVVLAPGTANFATFGSADKHVSISSDGQIGAEVGAFNEITYAGESLNVILNDRPKGVVYDATFTPGDSAESSTQYRSVFGAQFELEEDRRYLITCETGGNILAYKRGESLTLNADIRCMPTLGLPGLNDISTGRIYWDQQISTRDMDRVFDFSRVYNVRAGQTAANMHNLLPGLNSLRAKIWRPSVSGTFGVTTRGSAGRFTVIDVGPVTDDFLPSITDTRTSGSGGGDSDTGGGERSYTKTYNATWSQSYIGSGAQRPDGTNYLYQGYTSYYPAGGTQRSQIGFNDTQIRSDLSGASIQSVEVYVFYEHWWSGAGGSARIGTHSNSNKPSSFTGANTAYYSDSNNWPRGSGRWVKLNSAEGDRFKSGTARGITLNAVNTTNTYYGYARGVGQSYAPRLRIKYRK